MASPEQVLSYWFPAERYWRSETPRGLLALIIVLDQFSRNVYRGSPAACAQDTKAQALALSGLDAGMECTLSLAERMFLLLPPGHAEVVAFHDRALPMWRRSSNRRRQAYSKFMRSFAEQARVHRETVARFGRFPHHNTILARPSTTEEIPKGARASPAFEAVTGWSRITYSYGQSL